MLQSRTDPRWVEVATGDALTLLGDHAHCEKKAAASALSLVASYPTRELLVRRMSALAIEELRHFRTVYGCLRRRGGTLGPDRGDPYARALHKLLRSGAEARLVDRLLVAGLIEARSHERLELLAGAFADEDLRDLYGSLARAERAHAELFRDLAASYAPAEEVRARLEELAGAEAEIVALLPLEPRIH
jgi:tRNA-(ms[2]io[6]A)-hydroxylase